MFSKKTRNLTVAVLALIMALTLSFGLFGFNTPQANAAGETTISLAGAAGTGGSKKWNVHNGVYYTRNGGGLEQTSNNDGFQTKSSAYYAFQLTQKSKVSFTLISHKNSEYTNKAFELYSISKDQYDDAANYKDASMNSDTLKAYNASANKLSTVTVALAANATKDFTFDKECEAGYYVIYEVAGLDGGVAFASLTFTPTKKTYKVTYNYNDGATQNVVKDWTEGDTALTLPTPTRDKYTFLGWSDGTGTVGDENGKYTPAGTNTNITLTAQWSYNYVNVTVDGVATEVTKNTTHTLTVPTLEGKTFLGWSYTEGGEVAILPANPTVNVAEADITLYTCWEVKAGLLIYNSIDNTTETVQLNTNPTVKDYVTVFGAVDTKYTFEKWVDANGKEYALNTPVTGTETIQLYPVFAVNNYEYPVIEMWAGDTFDDKTLPTEYEGFTVIWNADATDANKYVGTLTAKDRYNVTNTVLTQNLSLYNYVVDTDYSFGTLTANGLDGVNAVLPKTVTLTASYNGATKEQEFTLTWDTTAVTGFDSYELTATVTEVKGFEVNANVKAVVAVKNAQTLEYVFDFEYKKNAVLTAEEWATIPDFSGEHIQGPYGDTATPLKGSDGASIPNYLDLQKNQPSKLVYTLPVKGYITKIDVMYAGGSSKQFNLVVVHNYVDGSSKSQNLATNSGGTSWVVENKSVDYTSTTQTKDVTFTSDNQERNLAIKSIKVHYVALPDYSVTVVDGDATKTLDVYGGKATLPAQKGVDGYTNLGWTDGTNLYAAGDEVELAEGTTVTALYAKLKYDGAGIKVTNGTGVRFGFSLSFYNITDKTVLTNIAKNISGVYKFDTGVKSEFEVKSFRYADEPNKLEMFFVMTNEFDAEHNDTHKKWCDIALSVSLELTVNGETLVASNANEENNTIAKIATAVATKTGASEEEKTAAKKYGYVEA